MISAHRTGNEVSFFFNEDTWLFDIGVSSDFPNHPDQMYTLKTRKTYDVLSEPTEYLKSFKGSMRRRIKDVLLEKERKAVRSTSLNK